MAITINSRHHVVEGNVRVEYINMDIGLDGDTYQAGMTEVWHVTSTSSTNNAIGATIAPATPNVVAFQTGGAELGVLVRIAGK